MLQKPGAAVQMNAIILARKHVVMKINTLPLESAVQPVKNIILIWMRVVRREITILKMVFVVNMGMTLSIRIVNVLTFGIKEKIKAIVLESLVK